MKKLRIHCLQHVPFEELGYIETWSKNNGHSLSATKFYEEVKFPKTEDYDWLVVMGGPMGVYEEVIYPWLAARKGIYKNHTKKVQQGHNKSSK